MQAHSNNQHDTVVGLDVGDKYTHLCVLDNHSAELLEHRWPGNVRELEHVVERALLLAAGATIQEEDLVLRPGGRERPLAIDDLTLDEAERYLIVRALARAGNNVSEAAQRLGLSRSALYRRLARYGITP